MINSILTRAVSGELKVQMIGWPPFQSSSVKKNALPHFLTGSRASAITQSEKNVGLSITNKIDSLLSRPGYSGRLGGGQTYLDMMLVLDSSGSIGTSEFREAKHATTVHCI